MHYPTFYILLLLFIYGAFARTTTHYEYDSFTPKQQLISGNKTILPADNTSLPVCPLDASPPTVTDGTAKSTRQSIKFSTLDLERLMLAFKSSARTTLTTLSQHIQQALYATKSKVQQFDYALFLKQIKYGGNNMVRPLSYGIRRTVWPMVYGFKDKKDDLIQWLNDIGTDPELEWYIFTTRLTDYWTRFSRRWGIDSFIRHVRQQISNDGPEPPFSHLDDLFKTMLETDHHGKFYRQQMAQYYQWLSPQDQERVRYSKREFTRWAKEGALKTHDFVVQTQQDWIRLMRSLYYDMETMLQCLSLPPPKTVVGTNKCLPNNRRQAYLLLSPPTTSETVSETTKSKQSGPSSKRQQYEWMFQLEQIHRELKITMECICPQHPDPSQHHPHQRIDGNSFTNNNDQQQESTTDDLESIEMLVNLKKMMIRRFARLDKQLYRAFFAATPPNGHQPMHIIYDRLRENVSAMNKSTYDSYLTRLILSWATMMAATLDTANSVADDLSWLLDKQHHTANSMELIWASAQRKMERNNAQLINQWEIIFTDLDHDLQAAWMDMLDMVDETHRSSFERVRTFWSHNKVRLSTFFSSLFPDRSLLNNP